MTLVDRQQVASDTMAFCFEPDDGYFEFRAGQHVDLIFAQPHQGCENDNFRTFSLASCPQEKKSIMIAMRMRKTIFKTALQSAALGTKFVRSPDDAAFMEELESLGARNHNFALVPTVTGHRTMTWPYEKGHINYEMLKRYLLELKGPVYYIAGPSGMVTAMTSLLTAPASAKTI
jgi:ferredoxin-NADP reductase